MTLTLVIINQTFKKHVLLESLAIVNYLLGFGENSRVKVKLEKVFFQVYSI